MLANYFMRRENDTDTNFFEVKNTESISISPTDITLSTHDFDIASLIIRKLNSLTILPKEGKYDIGNTRNPMSPTLCKELIEGYNSVHIHIGPEPLDQILQKDLKAISICNQDLSHQFTNLVNIGHQRQLPVLSEDSNVSKYQEVSQCLSLGQIRKTMHSVEPLLRTVEFVHFDLAAIRSSESGGESRALPTGLFAGEACQLMRYVGEGQNLRFIHIRTEDSDDQVKAMQIAQMVWYAVEGRLYVNNSTPEFDKSSYDSYIVGIEDKNNSLTFYRNQTNHKWWVTLANKSTYIPCSYEDYQSAVKGDISNNLLLLL